MFYQRLQAAAFNNADKMEGIDSFHLFPMGWWQINIKTGGCTSVNKQHQFKLKDSCRLLYCNVVKDVQLRHYFQGTTVSQGFKVFQYYLTFWSVSSYNNRVNYSAKIEWNNAILIAKKAQNYNYQWPFSYQDDSIPLFYNTK